MDDLDLTKRAFPSVSSPKCGEEADLGVKVLLSFPAGETPGDQAPFLEPEFSHLQNGEGSNDFTVRSSRREQNCKSKAIDS